MSLTAQDFKNLYPKLFAYAYSRSRDKEIAEELVGKTIVTALEKKDEINQINDLTAWCITIIRNKHLDYVKKIKESQFDQDNPEDTKLQAIRVEDDPFSNLLYSDCMKALDENLREVLMLNVIAGHTTKFISELLTKPQNTILTWLTKSKLQFRDCIQGNS